MKTEAGRFGHFVPAGTRCPGCGSTSGECHVGPDGHYTLCADGRHEIPSPRHNGNGHRVPRGGVGETPRIDEIALPTVELEPWQPFPVDALPVPMADMASEIGRIMFVDPAAAVLPMLNIAGASIGNTIQASMRSGYPAAPVIWSAVIQRSGEKKTPVLSEVMRPIRDRQNRLAKEYAERTADFARDLVPGCHALTRPTV